MVLLIVADPTFLAVFELYLQQLGFECRTIQPIKIFSAAAETEDGFYFQ